MTKGIKKHADTQTHLNLDHECLPCKRGPASNEDLLVFALPQNAHGHSLDLSETTFRKLENLGRTNHIMKYRYDNKVRFKNSIFSISYQSNSMNKEKDNDQWYISERCNA